MVYESGIYQNVIPQKRKINNINLINVSNINKYTNLNLNNNTMDQR